ncbi:MAG: hypothetical protein ISR90_05450 [Candidatus Marinimicrobia bacterium]|nr:hypothetical protein [Candidatus Neomarinimicrobiota bacterium]MBL7023482.1 hypothetical protein [Candidatus Neomarinimicrobiota bacterium]MBL7109263.1 hypothetical protein [Candidatus Neomarinimicrobiota bacterium]
MKWLLSTITLIGCIFADNNPNNYKLEGYFNESNLVTFYVGSFDIATGQSNVELFYYSIVADDYNSDEELTLDFSLKVQSQVLGFDSLEELLSGEVVIKGLNSVLQFSSTDINVNDPLSNYPSIEVISSEINTPSQEVIDGISDTIMESGKMPDGNYSFSIILSGENGTYDQIIENIQIYSPVLLDLVTPGGTITDTSVTAIYTTYPVFQWSADYCSACSYGIRVSEFNPENHSTLSEAINDMSVLPLSQYEEYYTLAGDATTFQYPVSDASSLEQGKLYAWQVKRSYGTTLGTEDILSDIYVFKIISLDEPTGAFDPNQELIRDLIGEQQYDQLFGSGGELSGYSSTNTITVNGEEIPITQLYEFLSQIQTGDITIIDVEVE